jgi:hypothetical protein
MLNSWDWVEVLLEELTTEWLTIVKTAFFFALMELHLDLSVCFNRNQINHTNWESFENVHGECSLNKDTLLEMKKKIDYALKLRYIFWPRFEPVSRTRKPKKCIKYLFI